MKQSVVSRYAPFLALAALQFFLVAVSHPANNGTAVNAGASGANGGNGALSAGAADGTQSSVDAASANAAGVAGSGAGATGPGATGSGPANLNDRSKCAPGGLLQENITFQSPPCFPKFVGDNGGATYQGVTKDKITVVIYYPKYPDGTQQVLAANNLAMSPQKGAEVHQILQEFFNKHYEFYGRQLDIKYYSTASSDDASLRADAKAINDQFHPFAVLYYAQGLGPVAFHEQLSRLHILNLGVAPVGDEFFANNSPYAWSQVIQGFRFQDMAADYYCKRAYGKTASLSTDPQLRLKKRKLAVESSENPDALAAAKRFMADVTGGMCGTTHDGTTLYTYSADPTTATNEHPTLVSRMQQDGITTVHGVGVCQDGTKAHYFPETFDSEVFDDDFVGRVFAALCGAEQMQSVFGIGMFPRDSPVEQKEWYKANQDVQPGYQGPYLEEGPFQGLALLSRMIQYAGPNLTPQSVLIGTRKMPQIGGYANANPWPGWKCCNPYTPEYNIGGSPDSYTAKWDFRQIYWSNSARSEGDGVQGAWIGVDNSKRYTLGAMTKGEPEQP